MLLDELVNVASSDHAINAGPAPSGTAMGDARQLAELDFYLADPQIRALIDQYSGRAAPATDPMAREQARQLGEARFEQLGRLSKAMAQVRSLYEQATANAQRSGQGPGWIHRRGSRSRCAWWADQGGITRCSAATSAKARSLRWHQRSHVCLTRSRAERAVWPAATAIGFTETAAIGASAGIAGLFRPDANIQAP